MMPCSTGHHDIAPLSVCCLGVSISLLFVPPTPILRIRSRCVVIVDRKVGNGPTAIDGGASKDAWLGGSALDPEDNTRTFVLGSKPPLIARLLFCDLDVHQPQQHTITVRMIVFLLPPHLNQFQFLCAFLFSMLTRRRSFLRQLVEPHSRPHPWTNTRPSQRRH